VHIYGFLRAIGCFVKDLLGFSNGILGFQDDLFVSDQKVSCGFSTMLYVGLQKRFVEFPDGILEISQRNDFEYLQLVLGLQGGPLGASYSLF